MRVAAAWGSFLLASVSPAAVVAQESEALGGPGNGAADDTADGTADPAVALPAPAPVAAQGQKAPDIEFAWTQFLGTSIRENVDDRWRYGGRVDIYARVTGSTLGLDDSITVNIHPELRYGQGINGEIGVLPVQTGLFYPTDDGTESDLSLSVKKTWKSGTSLEVGKVNVLDIAAGLPVVGGGGIEGFENLAFALPPSTIVPQSMLGAMLTVPTKKALFRLWVFDPVIQTQETGFESPFSTGVGALASVTFPVKLGGKPGYYAIKLSGTTRKGPPVEVLPAGLRPIPGGSFGNARGQASVVFAAYQYLGLYKDAPGKGWGAFGQVFFSDGDPTPLDVSGIFGVSGDVPFRPQDHFGLGWFRYSLADKLVNDLAPFVGFEDEEGAEAFYTFQVAKPLRITADVQYIDSTVTARKPGWAVGLRAVTRF
ncbi:carbohydrate porin [Parerythrobacter aurantius]|uniref:carbohydrate porin n=1 Tax=Parerythrobacter aurantius TaxID=3127706 RepID=UPI00324CAC8C